VETPFAIAIFMKMITLGTAFDYQLNSSAMTAEDTCLDAGIVDSTISGAGAYLKVLRVECP